MNDWEIKSNCDAEQEVYDAFKERLDIGRFIDKLWDALDEMEDDDLPTKDEE